MLFPFNWICGQDLVATATNTLSANSLGIITAYTSSPRETDSSPEIMASNKKVFDGAIANNCQKFGTQVAVFQEQIGEMEVYRVFEVQDRMNRRYSQCKIGDVQNYDIWLSSHSEAVKFGRQIRKIEILNNK